MSWVDSLGFCASFAVLASFCMTTILPLRIFALVSNILFSAYGLLAHAWGAEVGGWDRHETPYLDAVRAAGLEVRVSPEPEAPEGSEVFVSSAYRFRSCRSNPATWSRDTACSRSLGGARPR